jgi:hypothetical protein
MDSFQFLGFFAPTRKLSPDIDKALLEVMRWTLAFWRHYMDIKPIRSDADYEEALKEIERLWESEPGTPEGDRFEILVTLVEAYEDERYPIDLPIPLKR